MHVLRCLLCMYIPAVAALRAACAAALATSKRARFGPDFPEILKIADLDRFDPDLGQVVDRFGPDLGQAKAKISPLRTTVIKAAPIAPPMSWGDYQFIQFIHDLFLVLQLYSVLN